MTGPCMHSFLTIIGTLSVAEDGEGRIARVYLPTDNLDPMEQRETDVLAEAEAQIGEYLSGGRRSFDLPLLRTGTGFAMDVSDALLRIPYGETRTYGEVADMSGHPRASRAVGNACAANPLPIIVPCHRVVPASGGIGRYSGGAAIKRQLLDLERSTARGRGARSRRRSPSRPSLPSARATSIRGGRTRP